MKKQSNYNACFQPDWEQIREKAEVIIEQLLDDLTYEIKRRDHAELMLNNE
jgi:hypothetical protein